MSRVVRDPDPDEQFENATRLLARELLREVRPWLYAEPAVPCERPILPRPWQVRWTREAIREALQAFVATYHRIPGRMDWNASRQYRLPSLSTLRTVYGGRDAALQDADLRPPSTPPPLPPTPAMQRQGWMARTHRHTHEEEE